MATAKDIEVEVEVNTNLVEALKHAINIIESYELDIRNSKEVIGIDLIEKGFCQGTIYEYAIYDINDIIENGSKK